MWLILNDDALVKDFFMRRRFSLRFRALIEGILSCAMQRQYHHSRDFIEVFSCCGTSALLNSGSVEDDALNRRRVRNRGPCMRFFFIVGDRAFHFLRPRHGRARPKLGGGFVRGHRLRQLASVR